MLRVIKRYAPAVAAFGVLMGGSFGATAETVERAVELPNVTVRYGDLNLNTAVGVETLYARLRAASRQVCSVGDARGLAQAMDAKDCYRQVLAAAVDGVKSPPLSALHRESTRGRVS